MAADGTHRGNPGLTSHYDSRGLPCFTGHEEQLAGLLDAQQMNWLDLLQWPAMVATVVAAWLVASQSRRRRTWGFWWFLASNVLWLAWGWHAHAWAVMVLQLCLAVLNVRGAKKNDPDASAS